MEIIKSKDNSKIKYIRSLSIKKNREAESSFIVEGIKFIKEAINECSEVRFVLLNENSSEKEEIKNLLNMLIKQKIEYFFCEDNIFSGISETINSQGILAVVRKNKYTKKEILDNCKFVIMCDRIQDPGNLGTIIRTADAFGPTAIILNKGCVDAYNPKVVRATAGAMFRVPIIYIESDIEIISYMKHEGFKIISTVVDSAYSFESIDNSDKICIVIGNEGQGISQEIIDESNICISIKMTGRSESLNASIAAGISIYEIRKKLL
ncbi:TrmH family RNA methyltransferase [Sedimentibacter sp. MB31-C6]|uniref:TrmH family RNA methyltransferase n=1 Tax=Sedimentibacter sp. MB31-C6 TaxID=3109366 RepID=UPI002DDD6D10|nr:RNA methyltransferase [Sedimentibacter sp. MB36-C1]WSI03752.1 RNA methyltransferase [Sedimentibacter sp. MB36-C1]